MEPLAMEPLAGSEVSLDSSYSASTASVTTAASEAPACIAVDPPLRPRLLRQYSIAEVGPGVDPAAFGARTIGSLGSLSLLINNAMGPSVMLFPGLYQGGGFLVVTGLVLAIAAVTALACNGLVYALRQIPGNSQLHQRHEFSNLCKHYLPRYPYYVAEFCFLGALITQAMANIVQVAQCFDQLFVQLFGQSCGVGLPTFEWLCRDVEGHTSVFGDDVTVFTLGFALLLLLAVPLSTWNLDDNIAVQNAALFMLASCVVAIVPLCVMQGYYPSSMPVVGPQPGSVLGTVFFSFAMPMTVPSWVNEKQRSVDSRKCVWGAVGLSSLMYIVVGVAGAVSFAPYYGTDVTLLTKLAGMKLWLAWIVYYVMTLSGNLSTIPPLIIMIRYNLTQDGVPGSVAKAISMLTWAVCVPFYTGTGFNLVVQYGGAVFTGVVNVVLPALLLLLARKSQLEQERRRQKWPLAFVGFLLLCGGLWVAAVFGTVH